MNLTGLTYSDLMDLEQQIALERNSRAGSLGGGARCATDTSVNQSSERMRDRHAVSLNKLAGEACVGSAFGPYAAPAPVGSAGLTLDNVERVFTYQPWDREQRAIGDEVREVLVAAARVILRRVPAGPTRTRAMNTLIDLRMLANNAITWRGQF